MNRIVVGTVLLAAAAMASGQSGDLAATFRITAKTGRAPEQSITLREYVAEDALRFELENPPSAAAANRKIVMVKPEESSITLRRKIKLSHRDKVSMYVIHDETRTYQPVEFPLDDSPDESDTYTLRQSGSDLVAGLPCQKMVLTSSREDRTELCVAQELSGFEDVLVQFVPDGSEMNIHLGVAGTPWMKALKNKGIEGCPIRFRFRIKDSVVTGELTHLDRKPLPRALFQVPLGYRQALVPAVVTPEDLEKVAPEQRKYWGQFMLGEQALTLDYEIAFVEPLLDQRETIRASEVTVGDESVPDILARMRRERHDLDAKIDKEGFAKISGFYTFEREMQENCKAKEMPAIGSGPVAIIQDGHQVELRGSALNGCGVIVGGTLFLRHGCSSTSELVALFAHFEANQPIQVSMYDPSITESCRIGVLRKRAVVAPSMSAMSDDPKIAELDSLPIGLTVQHTPNPAHWQEHGRSGRPYTWLYRTTVTASGGDPVMITEFGAFSWRGNQWVFQKSFTSEDFSAWYKCSGARVDPGHPCTDSQNWTGGYSLRASQSRWYFIGVTADGRRVKGEEVVYLEATGE